jgi:hypothetical protein
MSMLRLDETGLGRLVGPEPLGEYAVRDLSIARSGATVVLGRGTDRFRVLIAPRDDAAPRAYATQRFNLVYLREGPLTPAQKQALAALASRLLEREPGDVAGLRFVPSEPRGGRETAAVTRRLAERLAGWARLAGPAAEVWSLACAAITSPDAASRHTVSARRGGLAFDLSLSVRGAAMRAGITLNRRAQRGMRALAEKLIAAIGADPAAAAAALAVASLPGVEPTLGVLCAGRDAKVKIYAQERRQGEDPLSRRALAPVARAAGVASSKLPVACAVACLDLRGDGSSALKVYLSSPPSGPAVSFARRVDDAGGHAYFTRRYDRQRAPVAWNGVFRAHRRHLREAAWTLMRSDVGEPLVSRLDELARLVRRAGGELAITAIGIDPTGDERDVYFAPVFP